MPLGILALLRLLGLCWFDLVCIRLRLALFWWLWCLLVFGHLRHQRLEVFAVAVESDSLESSDTA